jgi:hypothetical protein
MSTCVIGTQINENPKRDPKINDKIFIKVPVRQ